MTQIGRYIAIGLIYVFAQVLLFDNFTLANKFTPFVFIVFLLMLPMTAGFAISILAAFCMGLAVDVLSQNMLTGLHAFSCVLMMSIRNAWVSVITNRIAFRGNEDVLLYIQPYSWYVNYLFPLILVHHASYYFLEAFGQEAVLYTLLKAGGSSVYTFTWSILFSFLFYKSNKR